MIKSGTLTYKIVQNLQIKLKNILLNTVKIKQKNNLVNGFPNSNSL